MSEMPPSPTMAKDMGDWLDLVRKLVVNVTLFYGLVATFAYLYFAAQFFPRGVTVGDALLFSLVAFSLGLVGWLIAGVGALTLLPWAAVTATRRVSRRLQSRKATLKNVLERWKRAGSSRGRLRKVWRWWVALGLTARWPSILLLVVLPLVLATTWVDAKFNDSCFYLAHPAATKWGLITGLIASGFGGALAAPRLRSGMGAFAAIGGVIAPFLLGYMLLVTPAATAATQFMAALSSGLLMLIAFAFLNSGKQPRRAPRQGPVSMLVICAMLVLAITIPALMMAADKNGSDRQLQRMTFGRLGIRAESVMIALDAQSATLYRSLLAARGGEASICEGEAGRVLVSDVDVLWHGVGEQSLFEWPSKSAVSAPDRRDATPAVRLTVPAAQLTIIQGPILRCTEVRDGAFFGSSETSLRDRDQRAEVLNVVRAQLKIARSKGQSLKDIEVVGHADPMSWRIHPTELGRSRADAVRSLLIAELGTELTVTPTARSEGARRPRQACPASDSRAAQLECNAVNRRVDIRMRFEPASAPSAGATCRNATT